MFQKYARGVDKIIRGREGWVWSPCMYSERAVVLEVDRFGIENEK